MKPLLLACTILWLHSASAQSVDYISLRKQNGQVIKNFYTGSDILLQQTDGSFLQGPIQHIRNDTVYVMIYDIRYYPTVWGTYKKDTLTSTLVGLHHHDIQRVYLNRRRSFFQRKTGPLLMLGGGGYLLLNVLNGGLASKDSKNYRRLIVAAGAFGLGYLLHKLFSSDGFSKKKHQLVYVDL
jgi:hypothetical protein